MTECRVRALSLCACGLSRTSTSLSVVDVAEVVRLMVVSEAENFALFSELASFVISLLISPKQSPPEPFLIHKNEAMKLPK